jgi:hypothetical protein
LSRESAGARTGPHSVCLVKGCESATVGSERLCAIHHYQLPQATRAALALEDQFSEDRDRRLLAFVLGGQPVEHVYII